MESHPENKHSFDMASLALLYIKILLITGYPEECGFLFLLEKSGCSYLSCCSYLVTLLKCRVLLALKLAFIITNICCQ